MGIKNRAMDKRWTSQTNKHVDVAYAYQDKLLWIILSSQALSIGLKYFGLH